MGTDIVVFAEQLGKVGWRLVATTECVSDKDVVDLPLGRPYGLFSVLAAKPIGLPHQECAIPFISELRGFPDDMTAPARECAEERYDEDSGGSFGASWLGLHELLEYPWRRLVVRRSGTPLRSTPASSTPSGRLRATRPMT